MSRTSYTYPDGTVYLERPGTRWGRVRMQMEPIQFSGNEVMARAVQDWQPNPTDKRKGEMMQISLDWFDYLDNFHNTSAHNWLWTPHMLWVNRTFVGDRRGGSIENGADLHPQVECITGPLNIRRIIGETASHYEVWALPIDTDPKRFNPKVFNWKHYPWIFWKAQARSKTFDVQNVGDGLDVYHMNVRQRADRHWMHKDDIELFQQPPFTVTDGVRNWIVQDYMFIGASIYGITDTGRRVPLLLARKPGEKIFPTDWRCFEPTVIPPV